MAELSLGVLNADERGKARKILPAIGQVRRTSGGHIVAPSRTGQGRCGTLVERLKEIGWVVESEAGFSRTTLGDQAMNALLNTAHPQVIA